MKLRALWLALILSVPVLNEASLPARAEVSLENKQGTRLNPADYSFVDDAGQAVSLDQYFHQKKPVVLVFVFYQCPGACTLLLNGMVAAMRPHVYLPGRDFELVVVSIDPKDEPGEAAKKRALFLALSGRPDSAAGWHFLTTKSLSTISQLTANLGFHYDYDADSGMYNHPSSLFFFTQNGTLSTVLEGTNFKSGDFRKAIIDGASGRLGTFTERLNSFCLSFLPHAGWLDRPSRWGIILISFLILVNAFLFFARARARSQLLAAHMPSARLRKG